MLGVNMKKKRAMKRSKKDDIKVVYISSPMKVKTSASQFRAIVQELTGKDSDTARLMEANNDGVNFSNEFIDKEGSSDDPSMNSFNKSPMCSDTVFDSFDEGLLNPMEESFMSMLQSSLLS